MNRSTPLRRFGLFGVLLLAQAACQVPVPSLFPAPPQVLTGTWKIESPDANPDQQQFYVFDAADRLIEIRTVIGSVTLSQRDVHREVTIDGSRVRIITTLSDIFDGTLNDERTVISGSMATEITVGSITATITNGAATLTRQ